MAKQSKDLRDVIKKHYSFDMVLNPDVITPQFLKSTNHINLIGWKDKTPKNKKKDIFIFTDAGIREEEVSQKNKQHLSKKGKKIPLTTGFGILIQSKEKELKSYGIHSGQISDIPTQDNINIAELRTIQRALASLEKNYMDLKQRNIYLSSDNFPNMKNVHLYVKARKEGKNIEQYLENRKKVTLERRKLTNKGALPHQKEIAEKRLDLTWDLIRKIGDFVYENKVNISWNRSHFGFIQNEIVDKLATKSIKSEQNNEFNGITRLPNVDLSFSITEVVSHNQINTSNNIQINQKIHNGDNEIQIKEDFVRFKHQNHILTKFALASSEQAKQIFIESDYTHNVEVSEEKLEHNTVKELKEHFFEQNKFINNLIATESLNQALTLMHEHQEEQQFEIEKTQVQLSAPTNAPNYIRGFLEHLDGCTIDRRFKNIGDVAITFPYESNGKQHTINAPLILNNKVHNLESAFKEIEVNSNLPLYKDVVGKFNPAKTATLINMRGVRSNSIEDMLELSLRKTKEERFAMVSSLFKKKN